MGRNPLPPIEHAPLMARAAITALTTDDHAPTPLQDQLLQAMARRFGRNADVTTLPPIEPAEVATTLTRGELEQVAHMVVTLEMTEHPLPRSVEQHAERYLTAIGVETPYVDLCRDTAKDHVAALHADIIRNSWTSEETVHEIFHGHLLELVRSKLSYYGVGEDKAIARRWEALADCPEGSWGRGVHEFYEVHGFPFPGTPHGIYEVGAKHDWVHVLCDYGTTPEGEIDVFAFIAVTMDDPKGFVNFLFTLALFQNASVSTVGGKKVLIARADTLDDDGAADRLADSFLRAEECTADVMGQTDVWAFADWPLDELRRAWHVAPKGVPGPGAMDLPA